MLPVCLTVDAEPDCPPYLEGWRGMEEGLPPLLDLLSREGIRATFFVTGEAAQRYPEAVAGIVGAGHELGCHGWSHRAFPSLSDREAEDEIRSSADLLRSAAPVTAFRAPFLRLPERHLPLLVRHGFRVDASLGKYKPATWGRRRGSSAPIPRLAASTTSSFLRAPPWLRDPVLTRLSGPVVLFVHPWELVDLRNSDLRWDCRWGTGARALAALGEVISLFRARGAAFVRVRDLEGVAAGDGRSHGGKDRASVESR